MNRIIILLCFICLGISSNTQATVMPNRSVSLSMESHTHAAKRNSAKVHRWALVGLVFLLNIAVMFIIAGFVIFFISSKTDINGVKTIDYKGKTISISGFILGILLAAFSVKKIKKLKKTNQTNSQNKIKDSERIIFQ